MPKTIIVSNRLPITVSVNANNYVFSPSTGGLATCLKSTLREQQSLWVGWPGCFPKSSEQERLAGMLASDHICPVFFDEETFSGFYRKYANGVLWPVLHYLIERMPLEPEGFSAYREANLTFAEAVLSHYEEGDRIWIHDYHLLLLPAILRKRLPNAQIGFFLHIPFPASDVFKIIPERKELLEGVSAANLVGFHCQDYAENFRSSLRRFTPKLDEPKIGSFPIGVNFQFFNQDPETHELQDVIKTLKRGDARTKVFLAVDRLDYTKGVLQRLLAFERVLKDNPQLRRSTTLVQIAARTRMNIKEYRTFKNEVDACVGRINGQYGEIDYQPVHYIAHSYQQEELIELYKAADVMLVTPLRDGMNIVAKEFVAARSDEDGVLVLSELAGAAVELSDALQVNPYDIAGTAQVYLQAATMEKGERVRRMQALRTRVRAWQNTHWATSFLESLASTEVGVLGKTVDAEATAKTEIKEFAQRCAQNKRLNLLLDYDGTLVPIADKPELASPEKGLTFKLKQLSDLEGVSVHIVSGRKREELEDWFNGLPIFLHSEHGAWSRSPSSGWTTGVRISAVQKNKLLQIANDIANETPGSFVEKKTFGFAWHYRNCEPGLARENSARLKNMIHAVEGFDAFEIIYGKKVLEIRPKGVSKGRIVNDIKRACPSAVNIAFGDDATDEHMFSELSGNDIGVHIGNGHTFASVTFKSPNDVHSFIDAFIDTRLSGQSIT